MLNILYINTYDNDEYCKKSITFCNIMTESLVIVHQRSRGTYCLILRVQEQAWQRPVSCLFLCWLLTVLEDEGSMLQ
jgi:hypothetical protein